MKFLLSSNILVRLTFVLAAVCSFQFFFDLPDAFAQGRGSGRAGPSAPNLPSPRAPAGLRGMPESLSLPSQSRWGQDRATQAIEMAGKLAKEQVTRAKNLARENPEIYELDHNRALVVRGEVIAIGVKPSALQSAQKSGFKILREIVLDDIDLKLIVLSKEGLTSDKAIRKLRVLDPDATFDNNHVFFEAGLVTSKNTTIASAMPRKKIEKIGLIDTDIGQNLTTVNYRKMIKKSFVSGGGHPAAHGTAVAALLTRGDNPEGKTSLYIADVYGDAGRGGTAEQLIAALGWMSKQRVPVINVSLVGPPNATMAVIVKNMISRGFAIVAPVGNDGTSAKPLYPASYPGVIAVSAVDERGRLLPEASRTKRVDFVAVGIAAVPNESGRIVAVRGTSYATPIVARRLAEYLTVPDPVALEKAIAKLIHEAKPLDRRRPSRVFGYGLISR